MFAGCGLFRDGEMGVDVGLPPNNVAIHLLPLCMSQIKTTTIHINNHK
jgi:hypothetical protein